MEPVVVNLEIFFAIAATRSPPQKILLSQFAADDCVTVTSALATTAGLAKDVAVSLMAYATGLEGAVYFPVASMDPHPAPEQPGLARLQLTDGAVPPDTNSTVNCCNDPG